MDTVKLDYIQKVLWTHCKCTLATGLAFDCCVVSFLGRLVLSFAC